MNSEATKPSEQRPSDSYKPKNFDREVKDMVSSITSRLADLHKPGGSHQHHHHVSDEDEHGVRIITLAGNNTGATMRSELDVKNKSPHGVSIGAEPESLGTYVNSNFQAVNNAIMFGSNYSTNDPGVHLEVSDVFEQHGPGKGDKHGKKGKKKEKEAFKSDHQQSGLSD